jgi:hypothetical protein
MAVSLDPDAPEGFLVHSFAGDDWRFCREYVRSKLGLPDWRLPHRRRQPFTAAAVAPEPEGKMCAQVVALKLWNEAGDPRNSVVETYLASRPMQLPDELVGDLVRFHPLLWFEGRYLGAMITLLRDIRTDEPCGVHRTFLDSDGRKLGRKMLGRAKGAAIKLDPDPHVTQGLFIGEGFETCLAAYLFKFRPVWCVGSAGGIGNFPVLSGIDALTILAENDRNGVNEKAKNLCAQRWRDNGRQVFEVEPLIGKDLADVWGKVAHER